jgi:acyl dehydratase
MNESVISKIVINSYKEFEQYIGKDLGVSEYLKIEQSRINQFADATLDHQWMWNQIAEINNIKMLINYGIEKLKFNQPVVVDSEVRLKVKLASLTNLRGIAKAELDAVLEIKGNSKPAFSATVILLYHFN